MSDLLMALKVGDLVNQNLPPSREGTLAERALEEVGLTLIPLLLVVTVTAGGRWVAKHFDRTPLEPKKTLSSSTRLPTNFLLDLLRKMCAFSVNELDSS